MENVNVEGTQLTLGIENQVLTVDQTNRLNDRKESILKDNEKTKIRFMKTRSLLLENGFIEDVDFEYSLKEIEREENYDVTGWKEDDLYVTFTTKRIQGDCMLIYFRYDKTSDTILKSRASFSLYEGKVQSYTINGSARRVTFKTLKEKIANLNAEAQWELDSTRAMKSVVEYTVKKYQGLAPKAEVVVIRESRSNYSRTTYFDAVSVKFENGNLLLIQPGRKNDEESVWRFIDRTTANKSAEELARYLRK